MFLFCFTHAYILLCSFFPNSPILKIFPTDTFPNLNPVLIKDRNWRPPACRAPAPTRATPSTTRTSSSRRNRSSWSPTDPTTTRSSSSSGSRSQALRCWTSWFQGRPSIPGRLTSRRWPCPTRTAPRRASPPRTRTEESGKWQFLEKVELTKNWRKRQF